jgi:C4-dicarboxylate-specific signal transduction histidine kinase
VGIIRDITEIKKIQKSFIDQSKLASLGEVSAGMAHEINNPLSIVSGKMMLLKSHIDRGQAIDPIRLLQTCDAVLKNCVRIEKIVKALNSFSRNSERDPLEDVVLSDIVEELREFIMDRLIKLEIGFEIKFQNEDLRSQNIRARPSEIMQVLINLINNSIDAIQADSKRWIKLIVSTKDESLWIDIVDSGAGIKKEIAEKMMEFFFTTKPAGYGTGLGLSLAKQIMQSHGGRIIYVKDQPNTTFRIELPL